jgi:hypothetical protein
MSLLRRNDPDLPTAYRRSPELTIRWATPADEPRLETLARLDEARVPPPPLLLGLVGNELWVAASLSTGTVIADPFRRSAEVALLVSERGRQLTVPQPRHVRSGLLRLRRRPAPRVNAQSAPRLRQEVI